MNRIHWDHENTNLIQRLLVVIGFITLWMAVFVPLAYNVETHDLWHLVGILLLAWVTIDIIAKLWNRWGPWVKTEKH